MQVWLACLLKVSQTHISVNQHGWKKNGICFWQTYVFPIYHSITVVLSQHYSVLLLGMTANHPHLFLCEAPLGWLVLSFRCPCIMTLNNKSGSWRCVFSETNCVEQHDVYYCSVFQPLKHPLLSELQALPSGWLLQAPVGLTEPKIPLSHQPSCSQPWGEGPHKLLLKLTMHNVLLFDQHLLKTWSCTWK